MELPPTYDSFDYNPYGPPPAPYNNGYAPHYGLVPFILHLSEAMTSIYFFLSIALIYDVSNFCKKSNAGDLSLLLTRRNDVLLLRSFPGTHRQAPTRRLPPERTLRPRRPGTTPGQLLLLTTQHLLATWLVLFGDVTPI